MRTLLSILLSFVFLAVFALTASSQDKPFDSAQGKQGITVAPSIIRLDLSQDPPEAELYYQNNTHSQIELSFSAQDFSELEEGGRVKFLQEEDAKNYRYGLTSWITFEKQSITLAPSESQKIKVFVNRDKLTPGGHYATIQAELKQTEGVEQVPIKAVLSTLLFVRTSTGNEREDMALQTAEPIRTLLGFPDTFLLRLANKGNVELIPYGIIEIKDMFGNIAARGIVNEGSLITLPESMRRFDVPTGRQVRFIAPGIYEASINVHFGERDKNIQKNLSFISWGTINPLLYGFLIIAVVVTALLIRKSFQARRHQRR